MTSQPYDRGSHQSAFSSPYPLVSSKRVLLLDQEELAIGDRVLVKNPLPTLLGQDKIGIIGSNGVGEIHFPKNDMEKSTEE